MSPWAVLAIIAAGFAAGAINTIVGSGSLITFPTLLALGYGPIVANVRRILPTSLSATAFARGADALQLVG